MDSRLEDNLKQVQANIAESAEKAGRLPEDIRLIAVSKTRSLEEVQNLMKCGQTVFGENTIQDAMTKIPQLSNTSAQWHFIGHLQSKKSRSIPGYFQWVHSVDSIKLAQKLSSAMQRYHASARLNALVQINVSHELSKSGVLQQDIPAFFDQLLQLKLPGIQWRGLMTIGVKGDAVQTARAFEQLHHLQQTIKNDYQLEDFDQLSMGMSNDYKQAIEQGATMVRVGTAIFGSREK